MAKSFNLKKGANFERHLPVGCSEEPPKVPEKYDKTIRKKSIGV